MICLPHGIRIGCLLGLSVLLSACASTEPHSVGRYHSTLDQTTSLGSELVPMSDEEARQAAARPAPRTASRPVASSTTSTTTSRSGQVSEESSVEETTIHSTSTQRVIQTMPVAAPNTEVLLD